MRRYTYLSLLVAVGLFVIAGVAAATQPRPSTQDVSAAFTANQVRSHSRTCTRGGNTFRITNAVWRGTSTSAEPRLAGNLVISTRTVVNETTGDGWTVRHVADDTGTAQMKPGKGGRPRSNARLSAVIDNGNHLDGLATGQVRAPYSAAARQLVGDDRRQHAQRRARRERARRRRTTPHCIYRGGC